MIELKIPTLRDLRYRRLLRSTKKKFALYNEAKYNFKDSELTYAAYSRCPCGAGMAYVKGCSPYDLDLGAYWDCSDILKGEAQMMSRMKPGEKPEPSKHFPAQKNWNGKHTDQLPFTFYEIKSENQPSANGATTRPEK